MPAYTFECPSCALQFERHMKMSASVPTFPCPLCKEAAPRTFEGQPLAFNFADSATASTANTGVHKEDYPTADHIVGKDANRRWSLLSDRDKLKEKARQLGKTYALQRSTSKKHLEYSPMDSPSVVARKNLAQKLQKALTEN